MFVRVKKSKAYEYLQIVENYRDAGRVVQRVVCTLGRLDVLKAQGALDGLLSALQKYSETCAVLNATRDTPSSEVRCIGPALIWERLWKELEISDVIEEHACGRRFGFSLERMLFLTVLHRLLIAGSDRAATRISSRGAMKFPLNR